MITLLIAAGKIPESTRVRKPTGKVQYTLKGSVQIHALNHPGKTVVMDGLVFLIGEGSVTGVSRDTCFAIDFEDEVAAIDFLQEISDAEDK